MTCIYPPPHTTCREKEERESERLNEGAGEKRERDRETANRPTIEAKETYYRQRTRERVKTTHTQAHTQAHTHTNLLFEDTRHLAIRRQVA